MKLHEYQAKEILKRWDIPVPRSTLVTRAARAGEALESLASPPWVVKAQIHAGGRGKAGGVRMVHSHQEAAGAVEDLMDSRLVTHQTSPRGARVRKVLIEEGLETVDEFYLGVTVDRARGLPAVIFSQSGGTDIEDVAASKPQSIHREHVDPSLGWMPYQARNIVYAMDPLPPPGVVKQLCDVMKKLCDLFTAHDCSLVEINPLVVTSDGTVMALDAKLEVDDNSLFRQKELADLYDHDEMDPLEREAGRHDLSYIRLDGSVGCMVNGAGLAMATMDVIQAAGARPANFLDVGGGAGEAKIGKGLEIILSDRHVKCVLINIFGGILRCDELAKGVLAAASSTSVHVPLVVRLKGTNAEEGRAILEQSGLRFSLAADMAEAAGMIRDVIADNQSMEVK